MTKIEKLVEKFFNNPTTCKYSKIRELLLHYGFEDVKAKGSHVKYKHVDLARDLIIPVHNNECKDFYKKMVQGELKSILNKK